MVDTYFKANSYLDDGRLVYGDSVKVYETVRAAVPDNAQEIMIVLVNSKAYGGAGGGISWATMGNLSSAEVLLHELGHQRRQPGRRISRCAPRRDTDHGAHQHCQRHHHQGLAALAGLDGI